MSRVTNIEAITDALRQRNFAWYFWGGGLGLIGIWAQRLTIGWLTWELTNSGFWLGVVAFADLFPTVILTPIAGVVADRVNRHSMMFATLFLGMLQAFVLAGLAFADLLDIWALVFLTLFIGIVWAFNTAARLSLVPNLMERKHVPSGVAMDSAIFNLARFIGPMFAGYLIASFGVGITFLINGFTFLIFLACLCKARMIRDERGKEMAGNVFKQAGVGIRYATKHPGIGPILILIIGLAVGLKPVLELLPGVTGEVFKLGPTGLGGLMAASAVGATIAAVWLAQRGTPAGLTRIVIFSLLVGAFSVFIFNLTEIYYLGLVFSFFIGGVAVIGGTGTQTLMQNSVDGAMRGRVMSLYGMIYRGGPALGALAMGSIAELVGFQVSLSVGGIICLSVFIWIFRHRNKMISALENTQTINVATNEER